MIEESIRSIKQLWLASLVLFAVWLLSWPAMEDKLEVTVQLQDLHAWLLLKETVSEIESELCEHRTSEQIDKRLHTVDMGGQDTSYEDWVPIEIVASWPKPLKATITLRRFYVFPDPNMKSTAPASDTSLRAYAVQPSTKGLPFDEYQVVVANDRMVAVVPKSVVVNAHTLPMVCLRHMEREINRVARPGSWDKLEVHLRSHGYHRTLWDLRSTDESLARLQLTSDPRKSEVHVFGLDLSTRGFVLSVGFLFSAIAFAMIGPLRSLKAARSESSAPWIMVTGTGHSKLELVLEFAIHSISLLWAASPLLVVILESRLYAYLNTAEFILLVISYVALVFSSVVFFITAVRLRAVRLSRRPDHQIQKTG